MNRHANLTGRSLFARRLFARNLRGTSLINLSHRAAAALLVLTGSAAALAQRPTGKTAAPQRPVLVEVTEQPGEPNPQAAQQHVFDLTPETLEQWVFNGGAEMGRRNYEALLELEIEQLDVACSLTDDQKRQLRLAGAGELQRVHEGLAQLHERYAGQRYDQDQVGVVFQEIQPLQRLIQRRTLDESSLPFKLLRTLLQPEQHLRLAAWMQHRQRVVLRRQIDQAMVAIEQQVPLRNDQRQALIALLQAKLQPIDQRRSLQHFGMQGETLVLAQMNTLAPESLQAFLEPPQWEALRELFSQRRGFLQLLKQQNLLLQPLADADAAADADVAADADTDTDPDSDQEAPQ